ncbi:MAG: ABC transporter permease [Bacteroidetes bacterium]|nr:MAG: ABC transporter permease [Bacteroidota bacterium]
MRVFDADRWQEIFSTLKKNKVRTFFTAFGVFWGIFMLVIMMGSGSGLENAVGRDMGDMATNSVFIWTQRTTMPYKGFDRGRHYNFRNGDTEALLENISEIKHIGPRIQGWGGGGNNNVVRGERTGAFTIQGDYPAYNLIDPIGMSEGRFINVLDITNYRKVCVIGDRVKNEMFAADENPIGQYLRIQGVYFKVVGIFKSTKPHRGERENQVIYLPFTTLQRTYNYGDVVGYYSITSQEDVPVSVVEEKAKALLRQRHTIHPDDERAVGSFNLENEFQKMTNLFAGIRGLIWIVGIGTLLAGVIGVSNIMLIIVKERTREIGIQRAIGATPWTVISQVIMESLILTTIAGYIGLVLGVGVVEGVNYMLLTSGAEDSMFTNPEVNFSAAIQALEVLVVAGILAGVIPAYKAVSMKPIDALRNE